MGRLWGGAGRGAGRRMTWRCECVLLCVISGVRLRSNNGPVTRETRRYMPGWVPDLICVDVGDVTARGGGIPVGSHRGVTVCRRKKTRTSNNRKALGPHPRQRVLSKDLTIGGATGLRLAQCWTLSSMRTWGFEEAPTEHTEQPTDAGPGSSTPWPPNFQGLPHPTACCLSVSRVAPSLQPTTP